MAEVALMPSVDLSEAEWEQKGRELAEQINSTCWEVGDWLLYGEVKWGEQYDRASEILSLAPQTLKNYAHVSRVFPHYRRQYPVSFHHYALVAPLPDEAADRWLELVAAEGLTCRELQLALRSVRQLPPGKPEIVATVFKVTVPYVHGERWSAAARERGMEVEDWLVVVADEAAA